ncbi:MAG: hypothetical protein HYT47_01290 [Candidatus Vogelbacteria bacterium]|nr:hypothetical protein [Candidatus Vogelbacteria bacterium]
MMKKGVLTSILCLILLSGFSSLVRPNISFADHDRFHTLEQQLANGEITEADYNRFVAEENMLQVIETNLKYLRNQLNSPGITEEEKRVINEEIARQQAELRSRGRVQDRNVTAAVVGGRNTSYESCGWFSFNVPCWIRNGITFIGVVFKEIFGGVLSVVGVIFDQSVKFSISEFSSLAGGTDETGNAVQVTWKILRDLANLFFIFILLYIAIGMILQLSSFGGKRLLVNVIIVALLINFSAFFTRIVIDASNVAAYQFYKAIGSLGGENNGNIAAAYMKTLPLGTAFSLTEVAATDVAGLVYEEFGAFARTTLLAFGTVVMLIIAIFLFLAATILFAVRTVTLIFMIILSPLAFLMYAFPNQKGLFDKWLDTLLKQSFFAPLYLLMIYVSLLVLNSPPLQAQLRASTASFSHLVFYYLIAAGLMFGALIIAKSLGAKGASGAIGIGKKWAGYGVGAMYTPVRGIGRGIKHKVQTGLGQLETGKGRIGGTATMKKLISVIPYARAGMQRAAGAYRAEVAKKGEDFSRLKTSEMLRRLGQTGIFPTTRMAMLQAIAKKDDLDEVPVKELQRARELMKQVGVSTTAMEKLRPDAGENPVEIEKMVARHKQPDIAKLHRVIVSGEGANDVVGKDDQGKDITRRDALASAMINQYDGGSANSIIRRGDAISDAFLSELLKRANSKAGTTGERSSEQIIKYLEEDILKPINDKLAQKQEQIKQIETIPETQKTRDQKKGLKKEVDDLRVQAGKIASHARSYRLGNTRRDAGLDEFAGKKGPGPKTTPPAPANQPGAPAGGVGI